MHCITDGEAAIKAAFQKMQSNIQVFCSKHGLIFDGDFTELHQGLTETLASWRRIVDSF
jgi:flavorubredoxin